VLVALAPAVALLCALLPDLACSPALPCPVRHSSTMPSLLNLSLDLLLCVAGLCDLKSAGYLSLVNKQVSAAVTPVLPALCDVSALRLLLPFQDNVSLMHFSPTHEMWWALVFAKGDEYLQLAQRTLTASTIQHNTTVEPRLMALTFHLTSGGSTHPRSCVQSRSLLMQSQGPIDQASWIRGSSILYSGGLEKLSLTRRLCSL